MRGKTRFAPSPTGYLHEGHLLSALYVWAAAKKWDLQVHLRIEDHDQSRARPEYIQSIFEDLTWFGFKWDSESIQSQRGSIYTKAFKKLQEKNLVYPCYCSRKQLEAENPRSETGEIIYQGKCRVLDEGDEGVALPLKDEISDAMGLNLLRLLRRYVPRNDTQAESSGDVYIDIAEAQPSCTKCNDVQGYQARELAHALANRSCQARSAHDVQAESISIPHNVRFVVPDKVIDWSDFRLGDFHENPKMQCGDFPIRDRDNQWTYQFAVCVDDIEEGITHVVRGEDIRNSTARQIALMTALGRTTPPFYFHHPLVVDTNGKKLSKREKAHSLRQDMQAGITPQELLGRVCEKAGFIGQQRPLSLDEAICLVMDRL